MAKKETVLKLENKERIFTEQELQKFHEELKAFRFPVKLRSGDIVHPIDYVAYHKSKKTLNEMGEVIIFVDTFGEMILPPRYEKLENKIRQYNDWCVRKEYGKKIETSELDKLAESMQINVDDINF